MPIDWAYIANQANEQAKKINTRLVLPVIFGAIVFLIAWLFLRRK